MKIRCEEGKKSNLKIRLGPAGLGGIKEAINNLEEFKKLELSACEIAFTYGVYIKNKEDAERIGKKAKELVKEAKAEKYSDREIREMFRKKGWREKDIDRML